MDAFDPLGGPPAWIYRGTLRHRRHEPVEHAFTYSLFEVFLDVDRIAEVFGGTLLWSLERTNLASFRRSDYLGPGDRPLGEAVRMRVAELGGPPFDGPVWMLTHLRYFGYCFNPVSFYYCYRADGTLGAVLAEITNTPWGERHTYLVRADDTVDGGGAVDERGRVLRRRFDKDFHVSPFFAMDHEYDWRFGMPGDDLVVHMENRVRADATGDPARDPAAGSAPGPVPGPVNGAGGDPSDRPAPVFDATLTLRRRRWCRRQRVLTLLAHPAMTVRVWLGIRWQALRLWLRKVPIQPHPKNV